MLWIDDVRWRVTSSDVLRAAEVREGEEAHCELLASTIDREEPIQARARALRLLAYRERSTSELRARLAEDGFPDAVVAAIVRDLERSGLVDDERFAGVAARTLVDVRGMGRDRALRELTSKGIGEQAARDALDAVLTPDEERERAVALACSLAARPSATFEKVARRLARRGYPSALALDAAREAFAHGKSEPMDGLADSGPDSSSDLR